MNVTEIIKETNGVDPLFLFNIIFVFLIVGLILFILYNLFVK